jgi:photosystem I P700 chlorophyll a apoprotein A1
MYLLGFHSFVYIHNDTLSALGRPADMFSDSITTYFRTMDSKTHFLAPSYLNALASSPSWVVMLW